MDSTLPHSLGQFLLCCKEITCLVESSLTESIMVGEEIQNYQLNYCGTYVSPLIEYIHNKIEHQDEGYSLVTLLSSQPTDKKDKRKKRFDVLGS